MPGIKKTMDEWKSWTLRSGSKHGPVVKSQKQAVAIGLSEERKAGHKVKPKHEPHHEATAPGAYGQGPRSRCRARPYDQGSEA